jgi:hypothetical protein
LSNDEAYGRTSAGRYWVDNPSRTSRRASDHRSNASHDAELKTKASDGAALAAANARSPARSAVTPFSLTSSAEPRRTASSTSRPRSPLTMATRYSPGDRISTQADGASIR